jgi:threonine 3-dehydrogenase
MKALVFDKSKYKWENSVGFEKVEVAEPLLDEKKNPNDADYVKIKIFYAGVCGTDRGIWFRQAFREQILNSIDAEKAASSSLPAPQKFSQKSYRIIGHEFFGEIVAVGSAAAKKHSLAVGDFVTCESHVVCNKCYQCLRGEKHVCLNEKILGISHDGGFAEFAKVPGHIVWKTDTKKIRPEVAAMQEPFGNAVHAASKVNLKGKSVAIFGLGPIGMFLTLVARGLGASSIIGVEPNPIALEMAKKLGIDHVIPLKPTSPKAKLQEGNSAFGQNKTYAHNQEITDEIMKITNGVGVDVSFEMSGFNSSVNNCFYATRRGGDIILFGIKQGDFIFEDYNRLIVHGFTMHAVIGRQLWQTWQSTRALLEDQANGIQKKLFSIILDSGNGTILPIDQYTKEKFEELMQKHPKFLIQF